MLWSVGSGIIPASRPIPLLVCVRGGISSVVGMGARLCAGALSLSCIRGIIFSQRMLAERLYDEGVVIALKCRLDAPDWVHELPRAVPVASAPTAADPVVVARLSKHARRNIRRAARRRRRERARALMVQMRELREAMRPPVLRRPVPVRARFAACMPSRARRGARARGAGRPRGMASRSCARSGDSGSSGDGPGSPGEGPSGASSAPLRAGRGVLVVVLLVSRRAGL